MGLDLLTVLGVLGLTLLTLLLTGPGMWSEKWGWSWFGKGRERRDAKRNGEASRGEPPERVKADLPLRGGSAPPPPAGRGPSSS
ncbi:MAG TPA: hypothetical protein VEM76_03735 [Anaeromyxobacteraceae bacterium]|nr:hypothetical protein [Anaeromyxobacteraceae bacterium]